MSKGNNNNDNINDYLDLLDKYSDKEKNGLKNKTENSEKNSSNFKNNRTEKKKSLNDELSYLTRADFFSDYEIEENEENIDLDSEENEEENALDNSENIEDTEIDFSLFENGGNDFPSPPPIKDTPKKSDNKVVLWYKGLSKSKQTAIKVVSIILAVILSLIIIVGGFIGAKLGLLGDKVNLPNDEDQIYEDDDFEDIRVDIGSEGFKQALEDWAKTGNDRHMSSKNVINVLLIGADSRKGTNTGNTDVMMLLSLNKKTKQLKLISFFRDSYLFIDGKNNSYCNKLNAAFSMGGPDVLLKTIENNYKIDIDNYVMVNFKSFEAIIDAMGGVQVDVKQYEADYNYRKFKVTLPVGEGVTLNGEQALCFCRIRHCDADGDVSRTRRQRQVIDSIVNRVNTASMSDLNKYIDVLLPYVDTGYSKSQILSLGIKALTGGWAKYERTEIQMPPEDCRISGSANMWIWVVDYQKAANKLQNEIYGKSNIILDENRVSIIDIYRGANYTGGGNKIVDNNNNEATVPNTTEKITTTAPIVIETNVNTSTTEENTTKPIVEETKEALTTEEISTEAQSSEIPTSQEASEENKTTQALTTPIIKGEIE